MINLFTMTTLSLNFRDTLSTAKGPVDRALTIGFADGGKPSEFQASLSLPPVHGRPSESDFKVWDVAKPERLAKELGSLNQSLLNSGGVTSLAVNDSANGTALVSWKAGTGGPSQQSPLASAPSGIRDLVAAARALEQRIF